VGSPGSAYLSEEEGEEAGAGLAAAAGFSLVVLAVEAEAEELESLLFDSEDDFGLALP
jgi:hypothetical protein